MVDRYGRTINYLRVSVTDRCNLRCQYCMPESGILKKTHDEILSLEKLEAIVDANLELGIHKVRLTGGEPLLRKGIIGFIEKLSSKPQIKELTLTTNGILLKDMAASLKAAGINRINISLDTLSPVKYANMTRGGDLSRVLEGIEAAKCLGITPIKINVVLIGGFNEDEIRSFVDLTKEGPIHVRFIELMPIGEVESWSKSRFISNQVVLKHVPELTPLDNQDPSSPAHYYSLPNAIGHVGLISPISCKFCDACNRLRLTAEGVLKYCLHSEEELDLKAFLDQPLEMKEAIQAYIKHKPLSHALEKGETVSKNMVQIGG